MSGVGNAGLKLIHADTGIKSRPHRATPSIGSEQNLAVTLIVETRKRNLRASSGHVVNWCRINVRLNRKPPATHHCGNTPESGRRSHLRRRAHARHTFSV